MNRINDIIETTSQWLREIKEGLAGDLEKKVMDPTIQMRIGWIHDLYGATIKEESAKIGDCLAREGGAKVVTEYIRIFTDNGRKDPHPESDNAKKMNVLTSLCWNYSHVSLNFCLELGKAGLFTLLVSHVERCKASLEAAIEDEYKFVLPSLAILYNCTKELRNRPYFKEAKAVDAFLPYARMKNQTLILSKTVAILALAYLTEEEVQSEIAVDSSMIYVIVFYLEKAISTPEHKYNGFSAEELVDGLKHLAYSDRNKVTILNAGILPLLEDLLDTGDLPEKTLAAAILWSLSFDDENKARMQNEGNILSKLEKLGKRPGELGHLTSGALWFLRQQENFSASVLCQRTQKRTNCKESSVFYSKRTDKSLHLAVQGKYGEQAASSKPAEKHVMISYASRDKILALKLKAQLEKSDYRICMDMDSTEGRNFEAMMKALSNSEVFLFCVSHEYKTRPNCRMEAQYARQMDIAMIPLLVEKGYTSSGWLETMQGSKACFDFSDPDFFERTFASLRKELGNRGKIKRKEPEKKPSPEIPVEQWTKKQVIDWAAANKLAPILFLNVDGESLAYLRDMKRNSPEFYHKYVFEQLEISTLQDLKNLSQGLENLKL